MELNTGLKKIVLLHTNDIHSSFHAMSRIAGAVARLRALHTNSPVMLADCGDHMDRMSYVTEAGSGAAHAEVWEATGYDFIALGNNEGLTFERDQLAALFSGKSWTAVTANLREKATGHAPEWLRPSAIWEREGIRIGITGATAAYSVFYNLLGWQTDDPYEAIKEQVAWLREQQVDAIVVLSHLGLRADKRLAEEVEGIDIILGGHTHHVLEEPLAHGSALLCCCGSLGQYVGELELYFDERRLVRIEGRLHNTQHEPEDPKVREVIEACSRKARVEMRQPVALLEERLEVDWERDSPLGNLLAAGIRRQTGAELALINSGQLLTSLLPGPVSRETLLTLCPSPVNACSVLLRGSHILQALEESLLDDYVHMPIYGNGFRGKRLGGLCLDGLEVSWNPEAEPYHRIIRAKAGGKPLDADREYLVGTGDMFTFGTGYLSLKEGREIQYYLPDFLRHVLMKELNNPQALRDCRQPRYDCRRVVT